MDFKKIIKKIALGLMALTISMPVYSHASELDPDAIYEQYYKNNPYVYEYTGPGEHGFQFVIPGNYKVTNYGSVVKTNPNSYQTYAPGQRITLNTPKTIKALSFGQHYYIPKTGGEDGIIPVAYYECAYPFGKCIHGSGYDTSTVGKYHWMGIHDLPSAPDQRTCARRYESGWIAVCANCGKEIPCLIYGTSDALKTVPYLFTGYGMKYPNSLVYTCPWDGKSIEQGWGISHSCSRISQNRYFIKYDLGNDVAGTATKSTHYYGKDVKSYEGVAVTDLDNIYNLTPQKPGYIFKGWTSVKGSGTVEFENGCSTDLIEERFINHNPNYQNNNIFTLYAVWEKCDGYLIVNAGSFEENKGTIEGVNEKTYTVGYSQKMTVPSLTAPNGYAITFKDAEGIYGGTPALVNGKITSTTHFTGWTKNPDPLHNTLQINYDNDYVYTNGTPVDGTSDKITANWASDGIILPGVKKDNAVFDKWVDEDGNDIGGESEYFIPTKNITVKPKFINIGLTATENYLDHSYLLEGCGWIPGSADLSIIWNNANQEEEEEDYGDPVSTVYKQSSEFVCDKTGYWEFTVDGSEEVKNRKIYILKGQKVKIEITASAVKVWVDSSLKIDETVISPTPINQNLVTTRCEWNNRNSNREAIGYSGTYTVDKPGIYQLFIKGGDGGGVHYRRKNEREEYWEDHVSGAGSATFYAKLKKGDVIKYICGYAGRDGVWAENFNDQDAGRHSYGNGNPSYVYINDELYVTANGSLAAGRGGGGATFTNKVQNFTDPLGNQYNASKKQNDVYYYQCPFPGQFKLTLIREMIPGELTITTPTKYDLPAIYNFYQSDSIDGEYTSPVTSHGGGVYPAETNTYTSNTEFVCGKTGIYEFDMAGSAGNGGKASNLKVKIFLCKDQVVSIKTGAKNNNGAGKNTEVYIDGVKAFVAGAGEGIYKYSYGVAFGDHNWSSGSMNVVIPEDMYMSTVYGHMGTWVHHGNNKWDDEMTGCFYMSLSNNYQGFLSEQPMFGGQNNMDWTWNVNYQGPQTVRFNYSGKNNTNWKEQYQGDKGTGFASGTWGYQLYRKPGYPSPYVNFAIEKSEDYKYTLLTSTSGTNAGDGYVKVTEPTIGFSNSPSTIAASGEKGKPDSIDEKTVDYSTSNGNAVISFQMPNDNGTEFYYYGEAILVDSDGNASSAGLTTEKHKLTLTTGIYRYKYLISGNETESADTVWANGTFTGDTVFVSDSGWTVKNQEKIKFTDWYKAHINDTKTRDSISVPLETGKKFIHIVAVDGNQNYSELPLSIQLSGKYTPYMPKTDRLIIDYGKDENGETLWNIYDATKIENGTYSKERVYYVKADGKTPFYIRNGGYLEENEYRDKSYEVDHLYLNENDTDTYNVTYVPVPMHCSIGRYGWYYPKDLDILPDPPFHSDINGNIKVNKLAPILIAKPSSRGLTEKTLYEDSYYTTEYEGKTFIYPRASATIEEEWAKAFNKTEEERNIFSDEELDKANGLYIIGDGQAPVVTNETEIPYKNKENDGGTYDYRWESDWTNIDELVLSIKDPDAGEEKGSGIKKWTITNPMGEVLKEGSSDNNCTFELQSGESTLIVTVEDKVGNKAVYEIVSKVDKYAPVIKGDIANMPSTEDIENGTFHIPSSQSPDPVSADKKEYDFESEDSCSTNKVYEWTIGWTDKDIDLSLETSDHESGLKSFVLYESDDTWALGSKIKEDVHLTATTAGNYDIDGSLEHTFTKEGVNRYIIVSTDGMNRTTTIRLTTKIDKSIPTIAFYNLHQTRLEDYTADELFDMLNIGEIEGEDISSIDKAVQITDGFTGTTSVIVKVHDRNRIDKPNDSSGIKSVYMEVSDANDTSIVKTYRLAKLDKMKEKAFTDIPETTEHDNHVLSSYYGLKGVDLYAEFNKSATLIYRIYAIDNVGNRSLVVEDIDKDSPYKDENGNTIPVPQHSGDITLDDNDTHAGLGEYEGVGYLDNFSIKTITVSHKGLTNTNDIQNANGNNLGSFVFGDVFDRDEDQVYFKTGDFGHVICVTVGYTDNVSLDFKGMGEESRDEIKEKRLNKKYNLGIPEEGYNRTIDYTFAQGYAPETFVVYDEELEDFKEVHKGDSDYDKYAKVNGRSYMQVYYPVSSTWLDAHRNYSVKELLKEIHENCWGDDGLAIRIPPYYRLEKDDNDEYKWEVWKYDAITSKDGKTAVDTAKYIIYDKLKDEVHYRPTHES